MLSLHELQSGFGRELREGEIADLGIRANRLSAAQRLQVYRNNTLTTLRSALYAVYPVTERLLGQEFFDSAAREYAHTHPSHSGNIQDYGGAFSTFLSGFRTDVLPEYVPDVAALEWRRLQTALAPPHEPLDRAALAAVPEELQTELHFRHQPAARALRSRFPILTIWEFCQDPEPQGGLDISGPGECVLFARPALDVTMRLLSPGEYQLLHRLCRGSTFETACREALEIEPDLYVATTFADLVQEEIITGFYL